MHPSGSVSRFQDVLSWQRTHRLTKRGMYEMYATPAVDKDGNKIALDIPCYGDGTAPIGPESCGLTLWYSHDDGPTGPDHVIHRYASCDRKHSWFFTASATEANALDEDGIVLGHLEDDTDGLKFFKKNDGPPQPVIVVELRQRSS